MAAPPSVIIFSGPTLTPAEGRATLDAIYLPPAAQGDVYRAARRHPAAIGIIDGRFETVPAVWHKEILWAMSQGVAVFGSASMGALRAVELAAFGMVGVGAIFAAYQRGELEDDDEVAVAHGPAERGFQALSVALVNIRASLRAAVASGVIAEPTAAALLDCARRQFYPERGYPALLRLGAAAGLPPNELSALADWLPAGQVNLKRDDALEMLRQIGAHLAAGAPAPAVRYQFEYTTVWERAIQSAAPADRDGQAADSETAALIEEARLAPALYLLARQEALGRALAGDLALQAGARAAEESLGRAAETFQAARGLTTAEALQAYLAARQLDAAGYAELIADEATLAWARARTAGDLRARLLTRLRVSPEFPALRARALAKRQALLDRGVYTAGLAELGITRAGLLEWYFRDRLGSSPPPDLNRYARSLGFDDEQLLIQALIREYAYVQLTEVAASSRSS